MKDMLSEVLESHGDLVYVSYPALEETGIARASFMSRQGGVSEGVYESLNLGFGRGDDDRKVAENFRIAADCFGLFPEDIVITQQTHTKNLRKVTKEDAGKGVVRPRDYRHVDGLITDERGLLIGTAHADCAPVFLLDPVKRAIAMVHAGWKGTAIRIVWEALIQMREAFDTNPGDIIAAIGPCISKENYEVGSEVAQYFFDPEGRVFDEKKVLGDIGGGKYLLDIREANRELLIAQGVREDHISVSAFCTYRDEELFFSHRRSGTARGQHMAFMTLV